MSCARKLGAALVMLSARAWAGNSDEVLIGGDAVMTGGAVTAKTASGASIYYNPAGLAGAPWQSVDGTATAFTVRFNDQRDVFRTLPGTPLSGGSGSSFEILALPGELSYVRRLSKEWTAGFGMFVIGGSGPITQVEAKIGAAQWRLYEAINSTSYRLGPALAWSPRPNFRVGVSLLGAYDYSSIRQELTAGERGEVGSDTFFTSSQNSDASVLGLQLGAGFQWQPFTRWTLGFAFVSPSVDVRTWSLSSETTTVAIGPPGNVETLLMPMDLGGQRFFSLGVQTPARFRGGLALEVWRGWVAVDVDVQTPLRSESLGISQKAVWNGRVGGQFPVADHVHVGAGFFTDLTSQREGGLDFYGGSLGVRWSTARKLAKDEPVGKLVFSTTLGLRYAFGSGSGTGIVAPAFDRGAGLFGVTFGAAPAQTHEIALNVASSLSF